LSLPPVIRSRTANVSQYPYSMAMCSISVHYY
jgi:hypothetical protein